MAQKRLFGARELLQWQETAFLRRALASWEKIAASRAVTSGFTRRRARQQAGQIRRELRRRKLDESARLSHNKGNPAESRCMPKASDQPAFLAAQAPPDPSWGGMGALFRAPDPRDYSMLLLPAIAQGVHAGVTAADLTRWVTGPAYDQGASSACVAASTCSDGSLDAVMNGQPWPVFSWQELYAENGGTGQNGVDSQEVLKDVIAQGLPQPDGTRVKEMATYLYAPQQPGLFRQTLLAALAAGEACTLALLLPSQFGWTSGGARTSGYHQVLLVAGDPTWATIFNSWGDRWPTDGAPRGGLGRIPWDFIEADNLQQGYAFAYLTTRLQVSPTPQPPPNPQPQPFPNPQPQPFPHPQPAGLTINVQMDDGRRGAARLAVS